MITNNTNTDSHRNLLDYEGIKLMYRETFLLVSFFVGTVVMLHAVFNSSINKSTFWNFEISTYYIFPLIVCFLCFMFLIMKFLRIYRKVVVNIISIDEKLFFSNFGFLKEVTNFEFSLNKINEKWSYWDGFNKKYINFLEVIVANNKYIIPYEEGKREELINFLLKYGGRLVG